MSDLNKKINKIIKITDRENANVGNSPSAKLLQIAESANREFLKECLKESDRIMTAMDKYKVYPHDYSWMPIGTTTCVPDYEETYIRNKGSKKVEKVTFDYFNEIMELNKHNIIKCDSQEILQLQDLGMTISIYGRNGWTTISNIMRRKMDTNELLYKFTTNKGNSMSVTENHKVPIIRNKKEVLVYAKDIEIGDKLLRTDFKQTTYHEEIIDISTVYYDRYVFDLETKVHWFTVNKFIVHNCTFIPFDNILKQGFNSGHGYIRPPKRIRTAVSLYCIIFQSNQNDQHGGQAAPYFEQSLSPYVIAEYEYQYKRIVEDYEKQGFYSYDERKVQEIAWERTEEEVYQAMESLIHNLNSMNSRGGGQVPFTSINIGTGTSKAERMIIKNLLLSYEKGLGKGEQAYFPNIVFKVKNGVNFEPESPNYDMLVLAARVCQKRLFPIFNFQDCSLNEGFPEDNPTMGCRTKVGFNRHSDKQTCVGRGNLSFTTINTVGVALECKYGSTKTNLLTYDTLKEKYSLKLPFENELLKKYFIKLDEYIEIAIEQLLNRYNYQCGFTVSDFPFLMNGIWMGSENLKDTDTLESVLKHGTLTVGMIGLAETLKCLIGKHHGEDDNALNLGLEIVRFMRAKMDEASDIFDLNFSLIATPAEGLTGKLLTYDRKTYGIIEGVTDKEWYTNSFHLPVEFQTFAMNKIKREGLFCKYFNGGSINYIELKESPIDNTEGMLSLIKAMHDNDITVGAFNFPCDRCVNCGHSGTIETQQCPICGSSEIIRIARITGYVAKITDFNYAKLQETLSRKKHSL